MAIENFGDFFGATPREELEAGDQAEGYQTGARYGQWIMAEIAKQFPDRSRAYKEAIIEGLKDAI